MNNYKCCGNCELRTSTDYKEFVKEYCACAILPSNCVCDNWIFDEMSNSSRQEQYDENLMGTDNKDEK